FWGPFSSCSPSHWVASVTSRCASAVLAIVICSEICVVGQTAQSAPGSEPEPWSFSASVYTYLLPDEGNYAQPTFTVDHDNGLHLEARYNYEDLKTGSLWAGYRFGGGD